MANLVVWGPQANNTMGPSTADDSKKYLFCFPIYVLKLILCNADGKNPPKNVYISSLSWCSGSTLFPILFSFFLILRFLFSLYSAVLLGPTLWVWPLLITLISSALLLYFGLKCIFETERKKIVTAKGEGDIQITLS